MAYEPTHPQTNLSIVEYCQRLAYKYRNWLSESNKYDTVIPTEESGEGLVPIGMKQGLPIGFTTIEYDTSSVHPCVFRFAEGLLARQVVETLPFSLNDNFTYTSWNEVIYDTTPGGFPRKRERVGWNYELYVVINTHDYDDWLVPGPGMEEYPKILDIRYEDNLTKRVTNTVYHYAAPYPDENIQTWDYTIEDRGLRREKYMRGVRHLGQYHIYHNSEKIYFRDIITDEWYLYSEIEKDNYNDYWFYAEFVASISEPRRDGVYVSNEGITDRKVNVLKDVDEVASP